VKARPSAFLLDIEGTTTPLDFVTGVLFPYARAHVADYLGRHWDDEGTQVDVRGLQGEHEQDRAAGRPVPLWTDTPAGVAGYARRLMDEDRKATALKALQGRIWEEGFRTHELQGVVYEDVPRALARWRAAGQAVAIFSSGSVLAQKLLFGHTNAGDLRHFLAAHFDTTTGPKREAESYLRIARALGQDPPAILFVSDVTAELDAAREARLQTALCVRDGPGPVANGHPVVRTFDDFPAQAPSPTNL
jgi:enolase-phosphatase E1